MLLYDAADSIYTVDATRTDLAAEFKAKPRGPHSDDLRRVLHRMRTGALDGKHILINRVPYQEWVLAQLTGRRGEPPIIHHNKVFTSLEEAEWAVFKMRWEALTGDVLPED